MHEVREALDRYLAMRKSPEARWKDVFPFVQPAEPATVDAIREMEQGLGTVVPISLQTLLLEHNGYPAFFQSIDILSCQEIVEQANRGQVKALLDMAVEIYGPESDGVHFASAIVFGLSATEGDMFFLNQHKKTPEGEPEVVWFHHEVIERRDTLALFLDYLRTLLVR